MVSPFEIDGEIVDLDDQDSTGTDPELLQDMKIRPDGTPGSLRAYAPEADTEPYTPGETVLEWALSTRPKPYRMVNTPLGQPVENKAAAPPELPAVSMQPVDTRWPLDPNEKILTGERLACFVSARFDPDAKVEPLNFEYDESVVELELISTGGDPEAEAEKQALMAAHPEGKAIKTFRYGGKKPPDNPPGTA